MGNKPSGMDWVLPQCCRGSAPVHDVDTEEKQRILDESTKTLDKIQRAHQIVKARRLSTTRGSHSSCLPATTNGLPIPNGIPIPDGIPLPKLDQLPPAMAKIQSDNSSSTYCNGYSTAYTTASSYTVTSPNADRECGRQSLSSFDLIAESPGPASIVCDDTAVRDDDEDWKDDASLILDHIQHQTKEAEDERVSRTKLKSDWFDEYTMDRVFVKNDVGSTWRLRRVIQINEESVCIFNEEDHRFEYIDKRSSKVRPHPAFLKMGDHENEQSGSSAVSPMTSVSPGGVAPSPYSSGFGDGEYDKNNGFPDIDQMTANNAMKNNNHLKSTENNNNDGRYGYHHGTPCSMDTIGSIHEIQLNDPPQLAAEPSKCLYYYHQETGRDYMVCCTEWSSYTPSHTPGVYRFDLNYGYTEFLAPYPVTLSGYFEVTMDEMNEHLHIYCYPRWLIFDIATKQWNYTDPEEVERFKLPNIQASASIVVEGQLYIFGNGRCSRFDREQLIFEEVGFKGIDLITVWDIHDVVYDEGQRRIYIFGIVPLLDRKHRRSHPRLRAWHDGIYYLDIDRKALKWNRFCQDLPYRTVGTFADYAAVFGYGQILFTFYHKQRELWIFDLAFGRRFKCKRSVKFDSAEYGRVLLTKEHVLHSVCVDSNGPNHIKLPLHELLLEELIRYRNKLQADLVCGFMRRRYSGYSNIPLKVKSLIFSYFADI